jgi:hypothetical protein
MLAFKLMDDQYGVLTFCRIYSGRLEKGMALLNSTREKSERVGRMVLMHANAREEIAEAFAGDIVALVGLKDTRTGDTLCDPAHPVIRAVDGDASQVQGGPLIAAGGRELDSGVAAVAGNPVGAVGAGPGSLDGVPCRCGEGGSECSLVVHRVERAEDSPEGVPQCFLGGLRCSP